MNTFDLMERHDRTVLICHAIRHLLDEPQDRASNGDVDAVDILQSAISGTETIYQSLDKLVVQCAERAAVPATEGTLQDRASAELDNNNDVVSKIAIQRAALKRLMHESPTSLLSIMERLLKVLDDKALQNTPAAKDETLMEYVL